MMKNLVAVVKELFAIAGQENDTLRYRIGTAILRLPFMDSGTGLMIKLKLAVWIANDQNTV